MASSFDNATACKAKTTVPEPEAAVQYGANVTVPLFHALGKHTLKQANSCVDVSKSKTLYSTFSVPESTEALAAPFVVAPYIATAGTQIVCVPAVEITAPFACTVPAPCEVKLRETSVSSPVAPIAGDPPVAAFVISI